MKSKAKEQIFSLLIKLFKLKKKLIKMQPSSKRIILVLMNMFAFSDHLFSLRCSRAKSIGHMPVYAKPNITMWICKAGQ